MVEVLHIGGRVDGGGFVPAGFGEWVPEDGQAIDLLYVGVDSHKVNVVEEIIVFCWCSQDR